MPSRIIQLVALSLFAPASLAAQLPFSFGIDLRGGLATPTGDFASSGTAFTAEAGPTFGIGGTVYPRPSIGVFAGYHRTHFGCVQCPILVVDETVILHGAEAGLHLTIPLAALPFDPWVRAGVVQETLVFSTEDDSLSSEASFGFIGGAGIEVPLTESLRIVPALRYFSVPAEFDFDEFDDQSVDVTAYTIELGVSYRL